MSEPLDEKVASDTPVIDLCGKVCPYPVVEVIGIVESMDVGEQCTFYVDDPLAVKSIPEELEEFEDIDLNVTPKDKFWEIHVTVLDI